MSNFESNAGDLPSLIVVEDDGLLRNVLVNELSHHYSVMQAENGEQAIERASIHKPKLMLLDLLLPEVDGFKVLERLRKDPDPEVAEMPVIVFSNLGEPDDIRRAHQYKIVTYFVKSGIDMSSILSKVEEVMDLIRRHQPVPVEE